MYFAISNNGASATAIDNPSQLQEGELLWEGDQLPGNPFDPYDTGLTIENGVVRPKTPTEMAPATKTWRSPHDFYREFSMQEEAAVRNLARSDVQVETFLARLDRAPNITAKDPDLLMGRDYLLALYTMQGETSQLPSHAKWAAVLGL